MSFLASLSVLKSNTVRDLIGVLVRPQDSCHRRGKADAGRRHVRIDGRRGARAGVSAVTAWISASAVLADEGAVLVKLDVDAVSVLG